MNFEAIFAHSGVLGIALGAAWVLTYVGAWFWAWTWAWIDDSKTPRNNPIINKLMLSRGWQPNESWRCYAYHRGNDEADGAGIFFGILGLLISGPLVAALGLFLYPLTIGVALLFAIAHLARFARRHKKLFDKHLKDPAAHK